MKIKHEHLYEIKEAIAQAMADIVESETARVHELTFGAVRRDGGRIMAQVQAAERLFQKIVNILDHPPR